MMIWVLIAFNYLLGFIGLGNCTTAERFDASIQACGWHPNQEGNSRVYSQFETSLARTGIPMYDVDNLFRFTSRQKRYWEKRLFLSRGAGLTVSALELLESAGDLDYRDCYDPCTFVLAKDNCNAAILFNACSPRSREPHYIKTMLDTKVFSLINRCQLRLMYQASNQSASVIERDLYDAVEYIADLMTDFEPTSRWNTTDEMVSKSTQPFLSTRRIIRPAQAGFFDDIAVIMLKLERRWGRDSLTRGLATGSLQWTDAKASFDTLILRPCQQYIWKMHSFMDATIFYGRIADLKRSKFDIGDLQEDVNIHYFKLLRMYEACQYLDNAIYHVDWRSKFRQMRRNYNL